MARARSLPVPAGSRATSGPLALDFGSPLATSWTVPSPPNTTSTSTSPASSAVRVSAVAGVTDRVHRHPPEPGTKQPEGLWEAIQADDPTWATQAHAIPGTLHGGGEAYRVGRWQQPGVVAVGRRGRVRVEIGAGEKPDPA